MFSLSAEFPNDNPLLHRGVRWVCLEPTGAPIAEHPEPEIEEPEISAPEELPKLALAVDSIARAIDDLLLAAANVPAESVKPVLEVVHEAMLGPTAAIVPLAPPMTFEVEMTTGAERSGATGVLGGGRRGDEVPLTMMMEVAEPTFIEPVPLPDTVVEAARPVEDETAHVAEPRPSGIVLKEERADIEDEPEEIVVEELEPVTVVCVEGIGEPVVEQVEEERVAPETEAPPAPDDPFTVLVCTLADVALASGSPHVASVVAALLHEAQIDVDGLPDGAAAALREAAIIDDGGVTASFRETVSAWKALLRGASDDFMACGGSMLDEWSSELLARLFGSMDRAPAMRRELRNRGVAAFGLAA